MAAQHEAIPHEEQDQAIAPPSPAMSLTAASRATGATLHDHLRRLQRTAGNRATVQMLQRRDAISTTVERIRPPIAQYVEWVRAHSPTAKRHIDRIKSKGWDYVFDLNISNSVTMPAAQAILIQPRDLSDEEIAVRIMYESGNAYQETIPGGGFAAVFEKNAAREYKTADEFARAILDVESWTAAFASIKALEAGLTYSPRLDALVKAATKPDPDAPGGLTWASGDAANRVLAAAAKMALEATVPDPDHPGSTMPARRQYERLWRH